MQSRQEWHLPEDDHFRPHCVLGFRCTFAGRCGNGFIAGLSHDELATWVRSSFESLSMSGLRDENESFAASSSSQPSEWMVGTGQQNTAMFRQRLTRGESRIWALVSQTDAQTFKSKNRLKSLEMRKPQHGGKMTHQDPPKDRFLKPRNNYSKSYRTLAAGPLLM